MKVRNELVKSALMDYISETFATFDFSMANVASMVAAKMFVHNNFDKVLPVISDGAFVDVDALESIVMPEIERIGKFEVPGLGTKYSFSAEDIKKLIGRIKQRGEQ